MAKADWNTKDFTCFGGYLKYQGKFVARFKYSPKGYRPSFRKFLVENFTPAEYFERTSGNTIECAPAKVLESKGWVAPHILRMCKVLDHTQSSRK